MMALLEKLIVTATEAFEAMRAHHVVAQQALSGAYTRCHDACAESHKAMSATEAVRLERESLLLKIDSQKLWPQLSVAATAFTEPSDTAEKP